MRRLWFGVFLVAAACQPASAAMSAAHVLVVGCDGFGAIGITATNTPVLHRLMKSGAYTLHARAVFPTVSSPNWASIIMGAGPEQHGVTSNDWMPNHYDIAPTLTGSSGIFPTIFGLLRQQRPQARLACIYDWDGFGRLVEPGAAEISENVPGSTNTARRAVEIIEHQHPTLLFVHFDDVDHAGHTFGWKSPEYYAAVAEVDGLIGDLLSALSRSGLAEKTVVLMTADHGGIGKGHGGMTMDELEIPWIISGPGIRRGHKLKLPVNTYDTAATLGLLFQVTPPPAWIGRPVTEALN